MALTFDSISFIGEVSQPKILNLLLLIDLVYVLIIAGLVALRITRLILARRSKSVGSRLHVRLTSVFIFIALMPTVIVAIFATFSINYGMEGWFSDNVQRVVRNSMESAQAYEFEHRRDVRSDAVKLASVLSLQKKMNPTIGEGNIRKLLSQNQPVSLSEAFIVDYSGGLIISDWYSENNQKESIKITLRFLSNEIRADAINVIIHKRDCINQNCTVKKLKTDLEMEIKDKILQRAAYYFKMDSDKDIERRKKNPKKFKPL